MFIYIKQVRFHDFWRDIYLYVCMHVGPTVESYTVVMLLTFILIIITSMPSSRHSFIPFIPG